jgi:hypothetical protein
VKRPGKDAVWGLGGQLMVRKKNHFRADELPDQEELMFFLEMELIKDLVIVDMEGRGRSHLPRWVILGTGFSSRHIYRTGKTLVKI